VPGGTSWLEKAIFWVMWPLFKIMYTKTFNLTDAGCKRSLARLEEVFFEVCPFSNLNSIGCECEKKVVFYGTGRAKFSGAHFERARKKLCKVRNKRLK
jgi:hypothetical protein